MHNHLQHFGIVRSYGRWVMHGEYEFDDSIDTIDDFKNQHYDDIHGLLLDTFKLPKTSDVLEQMTLHILVLTLNNQMRKQNFFYKLLRNVE